MTYKYAFDADFRVGRRLERQQTHDRSRRPADFLEPAGAPRPDGRTDVMHCADAAPAEADLTNLTEQTAQVEEEAGDLTEIVDSVQDETQMAPLAAPTEKLVALDEDDPALGKPESAGAGAVSRAAGCMLNSRRPMPISSGTHAASVPTPSIPRGSQVLEARKRMARLEREPHVVEAKLHEDGQGLHVRTRDADSFYLVFNQVGCPIRKSTDIKVICTSP